AEGVIIEVPAEAPDAISSTVVLQIQGAPEIGATPIIQESDGTLRLMASEADLHGSEIRYESGDGKDNLGYWNNPGEFASWTFKVDRPGRFQINVEIASLGQGTFQVIAGAEKLEATAPNTGDFTKFKRLNLGMLEIANAGDVTLTVKPISEGWSPINLKSLTLRPVVAK
ncbi:MAG: hypothetical protein H7Y43_12915, partial [Akkermansiaceae bacterium]|nr:hypothetical protein [Verrucomicrobiales bacterium]